MTLSILTLKRFFALLWNKWANTLNMSSTAISACC